MNDSYTGFAEVYDELMDNVPYAEWAEFLVAVLKEYGVGSASVFSTDRVGMREENVGNPESRGEDILPDAADPDEATLESGESDMQKKLTENLAVERNTVLDLGCGTGTLTELLYRAGFDMIGVDSSEEMLEIALRKRERNGSDILYLLQDMREFELYGTVGAVCSVCDSLNYILDDKDMEKVFSLVNNYLYPGGIFVFDFNTVYKYEQVIGDATIAENREDCSFIWENYYDEESRINEYDLTIFVRMPGTGHFQRLAETHYQRGYTLEQMKGFVEAAGLLFVKALDADTHGEVREESERIYVIAREVRKSPAERKDAANGD